MRKGIACNRRCPSLSIGHFDQNTSVRSCIPESRTRLLQAIRGAEQRRNHGRGDLRDSVQLAYIVRFACHRARMSPTPRPFYTSWLCLRTLFCEDIVSCSPTKTGKWSTSCTCLKEKTGLAMMLSWLPQDARSRRSFGILQAFVWACVQHTSTVMNLHQCHAMDPTSNLRSTACNQRRRLTLEVRHAHWAFYIIYECICIYIYI
jgi:hypothetical protein